MTLNIQIMYFELNEWEEAFQKWKELLPVYGDKMQLVISRLPYVSGYWIEPLGTELDPRDICYIGDEVANLEERIRAELNTADGERRCRRFIT